MDQSGDVKYHQIPTSLTDASQNQPPPSASSRKPHSPIKVRLSKRAPKIALSPPSKMRRPYIPSGNEGTAEEMIIKFLLTNGPSKLPEIKAAVKLQGELIYRIMFDGKRFTSEMGVWTYTDRFM
jgi:hypothetical protein